MDAVGLTKAARHALAECTTVPDIVTEVWQAHALAEAVGRHLAACGPQVVRADARGLSEAGGRACAALLNGPRGPDGPRAGRLSEIQDPRAALQDLADLLGETGVALVGVAVSAEVEGLYWQCIEAIDAADEAADRISGMLRKLESREHGGLAWTP